MKLNTTYSDEAVETLGIEKSQEFGFSKDAQEMMFSMFTKNIYSNPIGSVVREITSNCFDSHKEAGVYEPVIIRLTKENSDYYISFVDVGVGMSRERITKIYTQYFNSTKRTDNNQIGGFGIGGKTPLAYADSFFIITIYNGTQYTYSIRKGTKSPVLDLLDTQKVKAHNGTTIKIPVRSYDISTFEKEIVRQLYYFENVVFEGFSQMVKNEYQIINADSFLYRGSDYNPYVHICLGQVAYPIDYSVFDDIRMGEWNVPVAIKLNIGDINVTASRESIDYTEATKKLLKKKLHEVKDELVGMLKKQHEKINTLEEYYRAENSSTTLFVSKELSLNLSSMLGRYTSPVFKKISALKVPSQTAVIGYFYNISMHGKKGRRELTWDKSLKSLNTADVYFVEDGEEMPRKKNAYLKSQHKHFYTLHRRDYSISDMKKLIKELTPDKSTTSSKVIFAQFRELQKDVHKLIEGQTDKYADVVVPNDFKSTAPSYNPNQELPLTFNYVSRHGHSYFDKSRLKISALADSKATIYYGTYEDEVKIRQADFLYHHLFKTAKSNTKFRIRVHEEVSMPVRFIMVSKVNLKYILELKNMVHISEFSKLALRKREMAIKLVEINKFNERKDMINPLFLNLKLFNYLDKKYAKVIQEFKKIEKSYTKLSENNFDLSPILNFFKIDEDTIKCPAIELFEKIEAQTAKNGMFKYIKIGSILDPNGNEYDDDDYFYNKKEIKEILELLYVVYVK